jgi:hypothetical protein
MHLLPDHKLPLQHHSIFGTRYFLSEMLFCLIALQLLSTCMVNIPRNYVQNLYLLYMRFVSQEQENLLLPDIAGFQMCIKTMN